MLWRARPRKRWRYVGLFGERLMACAATVEIGPARQTFWALHLPPSGDGAALERARTRLLPRRGEVQMLPGLLVLRDRGVFLDLVLEEEAGVQARCPHGEGEVWTRKQAGIRAHGTLALDGAPPQPVLARAVIDDTLGYHARETEWHWSAGVGEAPDGTPLAWNLVEGVNDPPAGSERAVWRAGVPAEAPPVSFAADLSGIRCEDGSELRFRAQAERSRRDDFLILASDYRAPFGSFSGTLPGGVELARGRGVMEHHRARW
ncbi:MAG: DUF2804 family protein [Solirubrobacteraceae bacterium]